MINKVYETRSVRNTGTKKCHQIFRKKLVFLSLIGVLQ